jgi:hypothetical protein
MAKTLKRWYDKNRKLAKQLDILMNVHPKDEFRVLKGLMDLIRNEAPDILNRFVIPSDIDNWHRRWYDKDPVYWLAINGLKHGNDALLDHVAAYLEKELTPR